MDLKKNLECWIQEHIKRSYTVIQFNLPLDARMV